MPNKWITALKKWNENKGGPWCVPKKGSADYDAVKALMSGSASAPAPAPPAPKKKLKIPKAEPAPASAPAPPALPALPQAQPIKKPAIRIPKASVR